MTAANSATRTFLDEIVHVDSSQKNPQNNAVRPQKNSFNSPEITPPFHAPATWTEMTPKDA